MQQQACIKCGDNNCDLYETPVNCPDDCLQNVTDCSQLIGIKAWMGTIDGSDKELRFNWNSDIPTARLFLQEFDSCTGENCSDNITGLVETPIAKPIRGENKLLLSAREQALTFYRIDAKIKIGDGTCQPKCLASCGLLQVQGWCDECEERLLKGADCSNIEPGVTGYAGQEPPGINPPGAQCCFIDTKSQGWYDISCSKATSGNLIVFDSICHLGAQQCDQKSNVLVRHTQKLKWPSEKTKINWIVNYWYETNNSSNSTSEDLLRDRLAVDYVAEWNPESQDQTGTAQGVCSRKKGLCTAEELVFTGQFNMKKGLPYFVSMTSDSDLVYAGEVPEHVTFNLVGNTNGADNYIALPVDTRLKKGNDVCTALDLDDSVYIGAWDPILQTIRPQTRCGEATFQIEPGKVYLITDLKQPKTWTQE
jgi:hypothetical protein